jgi:hypothetical protein
MELRDAVVLTWALVAAAAFLAATLPRLTASGRLGLAAASVAGFAAGSLRDAIVGDDNDGSILGIYSVLMTSALISTLGRPHLLMPGHWRRDWRRDGAEDLDERSLSRRRWVFATVMSVLALLYFMLFVDGVRV